MWPTLALDNFFLWFEHKKNIFPTQLIMPVSKHTSDVMFCGRTEEKGIIRELILVFSSLVTHFAYLYSFFVRLIMLMVIPQKMFYMETHVSWRAQSSSTITKQISILIHLFFI